MTLLVLRRVRPEKRSAEPAPSPKRRKKFCATGGYICEWVADPEAADREGEIWKKIPDSLVPQNKAYVSNMGRARNCFGVVTTPKPDREGYTRIGVQGKLLAMGPTLLASFGFLQPTPAHNDANHIDRNPSNNRLDNLAWCTRAANIQHSYDNNRERRSNAFKQSKPVKARDLGEGDGEEAWTTYPSAVEAARVLGLNQGNISEKCLAGGGVVAGRYRFEFGEPNEPPIHPGEEWKPYGPAEVSNFGRFKDCRGVVKTPLPGGKGYCPVYVGGSVRGIHILECELFLPPALPGQTQVNHIDGDKSNNHISNLEWTTPGENIQHSYDNLPRESNGPRLSKRVRCRKEASDDPSAWLYFDSTAEAARQLRLNPGSVSGVCTANTR